MAVVDSSSCGETELIFKMLSENTFYPKFNIIFLYIEIATYNHQNVDNHQKK